MMLARKNFFSLSAVVCQKYGFSSVMAKPDGPAHSWNRGSVLGPVYDSILDKSSIFHVLPMEKVPLLFSLDLWRRTRPVLRTDMMMTRGFSDCGVRASGGGGVG
jgi:hypothetical protein